MTGSCACHCPSPFPASRIRGCRLASDCARSPLATRRCRHTRRACRGSRLPPLRLGGEIAAVRGLPWLAAMAGLMAAWLIAVPRTGYPGAALVVTSLATLPPFLYQALQPMSDVPALAAWLVALALASRLSAPALAGAAVATLLAVVIRPNLAPLVLVVAWQAWQAVPAASAKRRRLALVRPLVVVAAALAGVAAVAVVQASLYGSPLQSGYGRASELFALRYVPENLRLYTAWIREGVAWPSRVVLVVRPDVLRVVRGAARRVASASGHARRRDRALPRLHPVRLVDVPPLRARAARTRAARRGLRPARPAGEQTHALDVSRSRWSCCWRWRCRTCASHGS